jgi:hypothetical protein
VGASESIRTGYVLEKRNNSSDYPGNNQSVPRYFQTQYPPQLHTYPPLEQNHFPAGQVYVQSAHPVLPQGYPPQQGYAVPPQGYPPQQGYSIPPQGYPPQQGYAVPPQGGYPIMPQHPYVNLY